MPTIARQGGNGVDPIRGGLFYNGPTLYSQSSLKGLTAHDRYGGGSVMIGGGITMTGRTELHICQGDVIGLSYRDNVIEPIWMPYARRHGNAFVFQDHNVRAHRACVVQDHLQFRRNTTLPWPA